MEANEGIFQLAREIPSIDPEIVFHIAGWPIANTFLTVLVIIGLLVVVARMIRSFTMMPRDSQNFIEYLYEFLVSMVDQITGNRKRSMVIFPVIGALLVYIGIANLIGLIPGFTDIQVRGVPLFRTPTSDFNVTVGLALAMVVLVQYLSIRAVGVLPHIGKYIQVKQVIVAFKRGVSDGALALVEFFVGILDIVSEFAKIISLSLRLFGNMYAGNVLAIILLGSLAYVLPAVWMGMSMLFGVVQALVFASLVTTYYLLAVPEEENVN